MNIVVACSKLWKRDLPGNLEERGNLRCYLVTRPTELTSAWLRQVDPQWVFFPHWSHLISEEIYAAWKTVIFHMTDVPFGRGGSPLQNLIVRGIHETQISALRCTSVVDGGPVYLKRPLSLYGTAQEIYMRAADTIEDMILDIIARDPVPAPQSGEVVVFPRRRAKDGDLAQTTTLAQFHDWVRMLDAEGYPRAFLQVGAYRLEFSRASLQGDAILADVRISRTQNAD